MVTRLEFTTSTHAMQIALERKDACCVECQGYIPPTWRERQTRSRVDERDQVCRRVGTGLLVNHQRLVLVPGLRRVGDVRRVERFSRDRLTGQRRQDADPCTGEDVVEK